MFIYVYLYIYSDNVNFWEKAIKENRDITIDDSDTANPNHLFIPTSLLKLI